MTTTMGKCTPNLYQGSAGGFASLWANNGTVNNRGMHLNSHPILVACCPPVRKLKGESRFSHIRVSEFLGDGGPGFRVPLLSGEATLRRRESPSGDATQ